MQLKSALRQGSNNVRMIQLSVPVAALEDSHLAMEDHQKVDNLLGLEPLRALRQAEERHISYLNSSTSFFLSEV